ncbi:carbohydrate-binding protein [Actinoplanes sp. TBRC 11911]|nr:carbohydrate-binding protein [Actinoplanes sp. TBRC 11911]
MSGAPSVYRTRSYVLRRRALTGLAGVALLLVGYLVGRWQDTPAPIKVVAPPAAAVVPSSAPPAPTTPPPSPTVYRKIQAESADALNGIQTQDTTDEGGGQNVGWIAPGDSLRYDDIDFGPVPATQLEVRVASDAADGGQMAVRLDKPDGEIAGTLSVRRTGGWQNWRTELVTLKPVTGTHAVYLTFSRPDGAEFVNLNWLQFKH